MKFSHLVYVVEKEGKNFIRIDRKYIDGRTSFFTEIPLPVEKADQQDLSSQFSRVASQLGSSLCVDSNDILGCFKNDLSVDLDNQT